MLVVAVFSSLGGGGLVDSGTVYVLQSRAKALHTRWVYMRDNGIPESDLLRLEQDWTASQGRIVFGAGGVFWLPGGAERIAGCQARTDEIWTRDLNRFRSDAIAAERNLHRVLIPESSASESRGSIPSTTPIRLWTSPTCATAGRWRRG